MSRTFLAALAAVAVVPASAHAGAGSSCSDPLRYHLSDQQTARVDSTFSQSVHHGPLTISSDGGDPFGGTIFRVQASSPWRVCAVRGHYRNGHGFALPGTVGPASFATRRFVRSSGYSARSIVVSYAHRTSADGSSCSHPYVVYQAAGGDGQGDSGARIKTDFAVNSEGRSTQNALWQVASGSHVCAVAGWNSHGHAWHVSGGGDGHHTMYRNVSVGNHDNSVLYLWIAFRR